MVLSCDPQKPTRDTCAELPVSATIPEFNHHIINTNSFLQSQPLYLEEPPKHLECPVQCPQGPPGRNGTDGRQGMTGLPGLRGLPGEPGRPVCKTGILIFLDY